MNEVKINFYSLSTNCSSIWTSGKALTVSQAAQASDELSVTDLHRALLTTTLALPYRGEGSPARKALGLAAAGSEHDACYRRTVLAQPVLPSA